MSRPWRWISCSLKAIGFRHLKVRADTLTRGMNGAGAAVAAEDFKKLLSRHGLNLIAERVEDEKTVVQLLDYTVDYAQGYLFGEPRAVREEAGQSRAGWKPRSACRSAGRLSARCAGWTGIARSGRAMRSGAAMSPPRLIAGLSEIARDHDALICDVWGVVHNGQAPFPAAAEALSRFRRRARAGGAVVECAAPCLAVEAQFRRIGVPPIAMTPSSPRAARRGTS